MSWYKTGTITVNNGSAAITGSGTAWVANAAAGEAIYLPDGKFYEINSVNSDISITLAGNYTGTSLAGQSYTILPSQSFIRDLAAQAAALINSYASIANTAGAGKFGDGTLGAPGISFVNDTNTGIRRTADGTFRLVANGVDIVEIGPGVVTMLAGAKVVAPRFDMDGWHLASYSGTELRRGNWESAGEWTEVSDYIHGVKRSSLTAGGLSIVGEISTPTGDAQALVLGKNQGGGAKLSYNTGTGNLDVTPRSGYNVHVVGGNLGIGVASTNGWGVLQVSGAANNALFAIYDTTANKVSYFLKTSGATPGRLDHYATYLGTGIDVYHAWWVTQSSGSQTQGMTLSPNSEFLVNTTANTNNYRAVFESNGATNGIEFRDTATSGSGASGFTSRFTQAAGTGFAHYSAVSGGSAVMQVLGNGNIQNTNNSYGAISDLKLKQDIVDAKSQWADVKALIVRKFRFKSDPLGPLMMGLIAQEAEAVSPGLIETTDDYEDVVVDPARTEVKIVQRQKTQKVTVEQPRPTLVDGRYVLRMVATEIDAPLFDDHPLYAEDGSPIMEIVEAEQLAVTDEEGNVVTPAKPAVTRQAVHRVPVMEDVEETVEIPAVIERRPTGTQTKSVKYSILYMKAVKALQEAMERIEKLEAEVAAIKGV